MTEKMMRRLRAKRMEACIGCYSCMLACARNVYGDYSPVKGAIQIRSSGGLQGRFIADICRGCEYPACVDSCPTEALLTRQGGGIQYHKEKCIGCENCVKACSVHAIHFDSEKGRPILCIQCGICVNNCPHQVLTMEGKYHDGE